MVYLPDSWTASRIVLLFSLEELLTVLLDEIFFESDDDGGAQIIFPQSSREYS